MTIVSNFTDVAKLHLVTNLPNSPLDVDFHNFAGYLNVSASTSYFYWLVHTKVEVKKLTIWLNGGPGCSSLDGLFLEVGPYRFTTADSFLGNRLGWHRHSSLLFLDQPSETGFSVSSNKTKTISMAVEYFASFLNNFYEIYPHMKEYELYLAGESYAGQYIPYFATHILEESNYLLKGLLIGGGFFDSKIQDPVLVDYLRKYLPDYLSPDFLNEITAKTHQCQIALKGTDMSSAPVCDDILYLIHQRSRELNNGCINQYYINLNDDSCGLYWPYEVSNLSKYLNSPDVQKAIHVSKKWQECNQDVNNEFSRKSSPASSSLLPELLTKLQVYLFAGEYDLICNYIGIERLIDSIEPLSDKFSWIIDNDEVGYHYRSNNLSYFMIYQGSHMAAYDHPKEVYDIFLRLIGGGSVGSLILNEEPDGVGTVLIVVVLVGTIFGVLLLYLSFKMYRKFRVRKQYTKVHGEELRLKQKHKINK